MAELQSCDTFVVLPPLTKYGVIFGKNSDRPRGEVQEVVYIPAGNPSGKIKCTYIEVDSSGPTKAVILSKPCWMWGAEMGANESGVVIGNEAVWTNDNEGDSDTSVKRLLGMDLVRLGLERSSSASEALNVICNLLKTYGQGGPCSASDNSLHYHNSFLIADTKEAWVLETSGKHWVAEHVTSGHRNISNLLTITTKIDMKSEGILDYAKSKGLWNGKGEFNFSLAFSGKEKPIDSRFTAGKNLLEKLSKSQKFEETDMFKVLRDKDSEICRAATAAFPTQGSQVSVLSTNLPSIHWFTATTDPSRSVFKPFIFTPGVTISKHTRCPTELTNEPHTLYSLHARMVEQNNKEVADVLSQMEADCVKELQAMLSRIEEDQTPEALAEFDELFKDCVETEVKFYR